MGGYGGGVWRKQFLLDLERGQRDLAMDAFDAPRRSAAAEGNALRA
jgi:hypothetical protein